MELTAFSALVFLPFALPVTIWVAWNDMKYMKIPNQAVLTLTAVFLLIGLIALPLAEYPWRLSHFAVVLAIGFVANMAGLVGAGDAKFAAPMAMFVPLSDMRLMLILFAAVLLGAFATHRLFRAIPAVRRNTADWQSWQRKDFPMGLALGSTLAFYLMLGTVFGA
ncbi:prepilin peptidase [Candidatus Halocynthiibacter alkanivorans]|uniref:prepilin peptidase n=1 Tax=Candidatus Halocynthiibacter alkanivorans TaxID=2267619 RepID=UPI000DF24118|nr:prepilin peptidase [Candidatus Halocynthiibacter alkanivorans]